MTDPFQHFVAQRAQRWITYPLVESDEGLQATSPRVREAVIEAMQRHQCDHYTRRPGIAALCQVIAQRLAAKDVVVDPNDGAVITGGAAETRYVALAALAANAPLYILAAAVPRYQPIADLINATIVPLDPAAPLPESSGGVLLVTTADKPAPEFYGRLAQWADAAKLTVIADEIDQPLLAPTSSVRPFAGLPEMAERTLTLGGFPDAPGLAAWQVAWFAGPKALAGAVGALKQAMTICSPAPGQYAALATTTEVDA